MIRNLFILSVVMSVPCFFQPFMIALVLPLFSIIAYKMYLDHNLLIKKLDKDSERIDLEQKNHSLKNELASLKLGKTNR